MHALYEHKSAAGAVYRAVLRAEVRDRLPWVWWRQTGRGLFEIEAVPDRVLREFSRRRVEIEERARELTGLAASQLSRERMQGIALATRKAKEYGVDGARWRQEAQARAAEHGLGAREIGQFVARESGGTDVSEADVVRSTSERLSSPQGLTANHNTFARRHVLAEVAGEFAQGASIETLERAASRYLQHGTVVALGRVDDERRFTTKDLLACEQAIVEIAQRRSTERVAVLDPRLPDLVLSELDIPLNEEQAAAARTLALDGQSVSVLQALAGTGKTRVLAAVARIYQGANYEVLGVAPTGRAARELGDSARIPAFTIHRLLHELDESGRFAPHTVILLDEAGAAPTRPSAELFVRAAETGTKLIVAGDSGQLPSVAAGGWFGTICRSCEGPELRHVVRQRDPTEREALEALHDGDPDTWLHLKHTQQALSVHGREADALEATLAYWNRARQQHGLDQAVLIARDNATRAVLNDRARKLLINDGTIAGEQVTIAHQQFSVGDRVIARRNDRARQIDNGTLARISEIAERTGTITLATDCGHRRQLDAVYVADHLEHAYALTGHGAQGSTVDWVGVIGRPSEFTREWGYTSLSRARGPTHVYLIGERTSREREREGYAAPEPQRSTAEAVEAMAMNLRRREAERLATDVGEPMDLAARALCARSRLPLELLQEAGAEEAAWVWRSPSPSNRDAFRGPADRERGLER